jgi:uncharacterized protein YccT (UPF0319 family)
MPIVVQFDARNTRIMSEINNIKTNKEGTVNRFGKY